MECQTLVRLSAIWIRMECQTLVRLSAMRIRMKALISDYLSMNLICTGMPLFPSWS